MADDDRLYGTFAHHRRGADHLLLIGTHGSTTGCGLTIDGLDWALSDFTVRVNEVDDLRAPFRMCKRCWASFDADPRRYLTAFGKGS